MSDLFVYLAVIAASLTALGIGLIVAGKARER